MDKLREALEKNIYLKNDLISHPYIGEELIGVLRSIESTIPTDCRNNFYNNLEMLRIISGNGSYCSLDAPVISLDEKLLWLADNNKTSNNTNFKDVLLEELYHEFTTIKEIPNVEVEHDKKLRLVNPLVKGRRYYSE